MDVKSIDLRPVLSLMQVSNSVRESELVSKTAVAQGQKRSSDFAFSAALIDYECKLKSLKVESQELESEKQKLLLDHKALKLKYKMLETERDADHNKLIEYQRTSNERISSVLKSTNDLESSMCMEIGNLREEALQRENDFALIQQQKNHLEVKTTELEAILDARSKRLQELEEYFKEKKSELAQLDEIKVALKKITSEKQTLEERLHLESSRVNLPEGYDRYVKGAGYFAKLEMEHDRLKSAFKNLSQERATWLVTQEENNDLKNQIELLKQWRQRALIAENKLLEKEALSISSVDSPLPKMSSPSQTSTKIRFLERENEILLAEQGETNAKYQDLTNKYLEARNEISHLKERLQIIEPQYNALKMMQSRDAQRLTLIIKERDLCRNLLASYEHAENETLSLAVDVKSLQNLVSDLSENYEKHKQDYEKQTIRINQLLDFAEQAQTDARKQSLNLPTDLVSFSESESTKRLRIQIEALEKQIEELENKNFDLVNKLDALEMKGAYNSEDTKILTFKSNPSAIIKENLSDEVVELRRLNERQRQRLQVLEERVIHLSKGESHPLNSDDITMDLDITSVVNKRLRDNPDPLTELAQVKEKLRVERLRGDRLMELFDKASAKFRFACRELLGYRVDVKTSGDCKVCPILVADQTNDSLFFKKIDGKFELVESEFTKSLPGECRNYLDINRSIPGFLASIYLYYLQQNTILT